MLFGSTFALYLCQLNYDQTESNPAISSNVKHRGQICAALFDEDDVLCVEHFNWSLRNVPRSPSVSPASSYDMYVNHRVTVSCQ